MAHRRLKQLTALPTVDASLTQLVADRMRAARFDLKPLLLGAGLTQEQISHCQSASLREVLMRLRAERHGRKKPGAGARGLLGAEPLRRLLAS